MKTVTATMFMALSLLSLAPAAAMAEDLPSYATHDAIIHGRISSFPEKYRVMIRDDNGDIDNVRLHKGTVINPLGLNLSQGMRVTIYGRPNGDALEADEVDTPYRRAEPIYAVPYPPPYYGPASGPYYGGYDTTVIIDGGGRGGWRR